jgi:hypothetical protein
MKLVSLIFLMLFLWAHTEGGRIVSIGRPLSMFRDDDRIVLGYAMFSALTLIGVVMIRAAVRLRREVDAFVFAVAGLLLIIVAATPSWDEFHGLCSALLIGLLYGFYAVVLRRSDSPWFYAHLAFPVAWLLAIRFHSYGLWQKGLILYFLLAVNVHHGVISTWSPSAKDARRGALPKKRKVYVVDAGQCWARRR